MILENNSPEYSVVIPVYNSEQSLQELCTRLHHVFSQLDKTYEVVLVDDYSSDNSWEIMEKIRAANPNVKLIQFMKNFGQHHAILCGFQHVRGRFVITMDDDLQNPPEEIPKLINEIEKGYDAVIGALKKKQDSFIKKIGSYCIRLLNEKIFNKPKTLKLSSFRIFTRAIADEICMAKTSYPYIAGILLSITTNIGNVSVKHDKGRFRKSTYSLQKLIKLSLNLIINYSSLPLRFLAFCGLVISLLSFCLGAYFILNKLVVGATVPGWTSVVVLLSLFNGILLAILSVMGEYLARIIREVSNTQPFAIRKKRL